MQYICKQFYLKIVYTMSLRIYEAAKHRIQTATGVRFRYPTNIYIHAQKTLYNTFEHDVGAL